MTKRDTTLKRFGPKSNSLVDLAAWRDHVKQHIHWIEDNRADLRVYQAMCKTYLREFLRVSVQLQKQRAAQNKPTAKAA